MRLVASFLLFLLSIGLVAASPAASSWSPQPWVTDNGGGTEWTEAAARILSPRPLTSEGRGFVRGPHWSEQWKSLAAQLRAAAASADINDRARLLGWATDAERARMDAEQRCIDQTWSAAKQFAAILQDNGAAAIIGTRTGGAGGGHTNGETPIILKNSGATLELPDCARFRAGGSNEVAGIIPDVLTGMKASDGRAFKAQLIEAHLAQALNLASDRQQH